MNVCGVAEKEHEAEDIMHNKTLKLKKNTKQQQI